MGLNTVLNTVANDDLNDRMHHCYTFLLLLLCVALTCKQQYLGSPVSCWVPKEFTDAHKEYAETICWSMNTYHLGHDVPIPAKVPERRAEELTYYQWVSFLLLAQALMFQLPCSLWRSCLAARGLRLDWAIAMAGDAGTLVSKQMRQKAIFTVASHLSEALDAATNRQSATADESLVGRIYARVDPPDFRLSRAYLVSKMLYIGITASQFTIINSYLTAGSGTVTYGLSLAVNLTLGRPWEESGYFPRVTYCDFLIRVLGNVQRHTVQCVLQINRLNEKVYALLWFWMLGLACLTVRSLLLWSHRLAWPAARANYLARLMRIRGCFDLVCGNDCRSGKNRGISNFANRLGPDGVLLLLLVDCNAGPSVAAEVCEELWRSGDRQRALPPAKECSGQESASVSVNQWQSDNQV